MNRGQAAWLILLVVAASAYRSALDSDRPEGIAQKLPAGPIVGLPIR